MKRASWVAMLVGSGLAFAGAWGASTGQLDSTALRQAALATARTIRLTAVPTERVAVPRLPPPGSAAPVASAPPIASSPPLVASAPLPVASTQAASLATPPDEPEPDAAPSEEEHDPTPPPPPKGPELVATLKETWVYAQPTHRARKLGYLRAGATVQRSEKPVTRAGCEGGWYRVAPKGYVCAGPGASLNLDHPVREMAARRPDRKAGLPYLYGMSRYPTPPFYLRLPNAPEQKVVEGDLTGHLARSRAAMKQQTLDLGPVPGMLLYGHVVPSLTPQPHGDRSLYAGRAVPRSGFAMVSQFEWENRLWGLTTDFQIVPLDRMRLLTPSTFHGIELEGSPAAFSRSKASRYFKVDEKTGAVVDDGPIAFREGIALTGSVKRVGGVAFLEARDGRLVREEGLVRVDPPHEWPGFAVEGKKWIDVSILRQTLVAYEGKKAVYATLVSTGADGLGDPKKTHSTVRGTFLIHTKHVAITMDSDEADDRFDLRDVPYVQYFHEGYALHAAYWHDDFGKPRSHGCINLHPTDAAWLFAWTTPDVPEAWHAALTLREGTVVHIHP